MRVLPMLSLSFALAAQVPDVGLTMDGGMLTVIYGQSCGPVTCTPFVGGAVAGGETRNLVHTSSPNTAYVIALGLPGPCTRFPGIDNMLLLGAPITTVTVGTTGGPNPVSACRQGAGRAQLMVPRGVPAGIVFRLQSFGTSASSQGPAFSGAIEVRTV